MVHSKFREDRPDLDPIAIECLGGYVSLQKAMPSGRKCHYCSAKATTRDHVVPASRGGVHSWINLVPSCVECQHIKADALPVCPCKFCVRALGRWRNGKRLDTFR